MLLFYRITFAFVLASTIWDASPAFAQGQALDGIIEGVVRLQSDNKTVAGATVRAFNAGTGYDHTSYFTVLPASGLPEALDIQSDALRKIGRAHV